MKSIVSSPDVRELGPDDVQWFDILVLGATEQHQILDTTVSRAQITSHHITSHHIAKACHA